MEPAPLNLASPADICGRRITVMGLGSFGGGIGAVQYLAAHGAQVTVTDQRSADQLRDSLAQIAGLNVTLHLGGHATEDFNQADLVVVSPAVAPSNPFVSLAQSAGVPLSSEMNLFWERNPGRVIAVTGTNGKSTTTAMIYALLKSHDIPCWLGGNIGVSLLPVVHQIRAGDWVVLELSSFQLEALEPLRPQPDVAVVTNFSPNHLDRHGTLDSYRQAKQQILKWQTAGQLAILNADDADVRAWETAANKIWFGSSVTEEWPLADWLKLPGTHNRLNALAAVRAARAAGVSRVSAAVGLRAFTALPHRLEFVGDVAGVRFVNDSKATTPEAAILALDAFSSPVVALVGGSDKGADLAPLARALADKPVRAVALLGQTAETLAGHLAAVPEIVFQTFQEFAPAVEWARRQSQPGDTVLLSPGCASYGMFQNYEARGAEFRRLVEGYQCSARR